MLTDRIKEYFARDGAVAWWNVEGTPRYDKQIATIGKLTNVRGSDVLDVGTGRGRFAIYFALGGASSVTAVDISSKMLEIARSNAREQRVIDKIRFVCSDVLQLKLEQQFDLITCMELFVHLPSPLKHIELLYSLLKPGGMLVANVEVGSNKEWVNHPILKLKKSARSAAKFIYFRTPAWFRRDILYRHFKVPFRSSHPIHVERFTVEESISLLETNPEVKHLRPTDAINRMSKNDFLELFEKAHFDICNVIREGSRIAPYGYIVFARKAF